jgi:O-antigen ligase/tetratricopeptide (TPR) repeat protein
VFAVCILEAALKKKAQDTPSKKPGALTRRMAGYSTFLDDLRHDRGLWFIVYFAVVIAYLLLNQGGSIDLSRAPQWAFRALAFGGLIIFGILDSRRIRSMIGRVNLLAVLPISVFLIIVTSNIVSIRPFETVEESMNILAYAAIAFLCFTYIDSLKRLRQIVEVMLVAGFLIAAHGLFIFYGALWSRGETTPLSSLFYWHNPAAGFLLLIWPTMLAQFYSMRRGWQTFLILYIFYFTFTAFGLTLSRGGWLAGFIPFLLIPFILSRRKMMVSWRPVVLIVLYFISAIPFVLKYRGRFFQPIIDRWNQLRLDDYSVIGRFEFWDIAWKVFLKHPLVGIGFNTFGYYYVNYQQNPQYYTKDPHNVYLRFLAEGGIIGAAVIISLLVIIGGLIMRTLRTPPGRMLTVYRVGLLGGIVAELLHMALDFDWTFPIIPLLLVCQVAIVARTFHYPDNEQNLTVEQWEPEEESAVEVPIETPKRGFYLKPIWIWLGIALFCFVVNVLGYTSMSIYEKGKNLVDNQAMLAQSRANEQMSQLQREQWRMQTQEIPTYTEILGAQRTGIIREGMYYWKQSLTYNPWNWYALKDLVTAHYYGALDLLSSASGINPEPIVQAGLEYGHRLLEVTPHRPASYYYVGQLEIVAGRLRADEDLEHQGLQKMLHSIELDPQNIPKYYLGIAQYYYEEGDLDEALRYIAIMEEKFVPRYDSGDIDFGALKGKSLARQDWIDITETMRQAWWLKGEILDRQGQKEAALQAFYNGFNTPLGGGEMAEEFLDLGMLQLPFLLRIAEISADLEDWATVDIRTRQAMGIIEENNLQGTEDSQKAYELFYRAQPHIREMLEESEAPDESI